MAQYRYRARNKTGEIISGLIDANSFEAAEKTLSDHGLTVVNLEVPKSILETLRIGNKITVKQKAFVARQMATMVNAGLPLTQVLHLLQKSERHPLMQRTLEAVQKDIEAGYSFSTAISRHPEVFSRVFVNAVRAGEATGKLEVVLKELATSLERDAAASSKLKALMIYPIFIITAMLIVGAIMMVKVVPVLSDIFSEARQALPFATRILIWVSLLIRSYWWIIILAAIGLFLFFRAYGRTDQGKAFIDRLKLRVYIIKDLSSLFYMARFTRTLGMLIGAGVPLLEAIQITSDAMDNDLYRSSLEQAASQVERGVALSVAMQKSNLYPPLVAQMVLVGEQSGELDKVLQKLSATYEEEYDVKMRSATTLIEPIVVIILGLGVAFLVFAILVPIYQISMLQ